MDETIPEHDRILVLVVYTGTNPSFPNSLPLGLDFMQCSLPSSLQIYDAPLAHTPPAQLEKTLTAFLPPSPNSACELSPLCGIPANLDPPGPVTAFPAIRVLYRC